MRAELARQGEERPAAGWRLQGLLLTLGPVLLVLLTASRAESLRQIQGDPLAIAGAIAAAGLTAAGLLYRRSPRTARALATLAALVAGGVLLGEWYRQPAAILVGLLAIGGLLNRIWPVPEPRPEPEDPAARARSAAWVALAAWGMTIFTGWSGAYLGHLVLAAGVVMSGLIGVRWWWTEKPRWRSWAWFIGGLALAGLGAGVQAARPVESLALMIAAPLGLLVAARPVRRGGEEEEEDVWWDDFLTHPAQAMVVTFALLCLGGGLLLSVPAMHAAPGSVPLVDAFFTAVSAVCVTGLVTLDIPTAFSTVGHVAILLLIQVGGLGIMTFSTLALVALGRRMSVRHEATAINLLGGEGRSDLAGALRRVSLVTFSAEALGAAGLTVCFLMEGDALGMAAWRGIFTAVSAFCNAGFGLQSANIVPYNHNPAILHIIALLIILGGLGPAVVLSVPAMLRQKRVSLHARVVVLATAVLLIAPTALIAMLEWGHSLAPLSFADKLHNAWFQAVNPRTAGFNSVDLALMHPATQMLLWGLMFIGGSPGSTAGGIKTTTAMVLILAGVAAIRGTDRVEFEGREIPTRTVFKAAATVAVGVGLAAAAIMGLMLTQELPLGMVVFEVFSALGTVGLTIGATPRVDAIGKIVLMICMYIGRLGPLTLFLILSRRGDEVGQGALPREDVAVG